MCKDTCNKCNECNPCDRKCNQQDCGCKFEVDAMCVRYTKNDLECSGLPKGTILEDIIEAFDRKLCETGDVNQVVVEAGDNVTVDTSVDGNTTTYTVNAETGGNCSLDVEITAAGITGATSTVSGGTPPYTYKWRYAQNTFTANTIIIDNSLPNITFGGTPCDMLSNPECVLSTGEEASSILQPSFFIPMYLTLKVRDSLGCVGQDSYMAYLTYYN